MDQKLGKNNLITLILIFGGIAGFFVSMQILGLFGSKIEYNFHGFIKESVPFLFLSIGVYGIGYSSGGHRLGVKYLIGFIILYLFATFQGYYKNR